ncbi:hypothetical protein KC963_03500, partial [Candidatus Saccharibacteria bacterium]|nr:hypothetical protein [Candidatus Saccharibacteria bacterium]
KVVADADKTEFVSNQITERQEKWLVKQVERLFVEAETVARPTQEQVDKLYVLVGSLKILGLDGAAQSFIPRLSKLKVS